MAEEKQKRINEILSTIQRELKAPKTQKNSFGNYMYRKAEDILNAIKPLLPDGIYIKCNDELVMIGDRYYIKSTASIEDGTSVINSVGYAREEETKKGMDGSQVTGASSSYARKYALNGLFAIDDTVDSDGTNTHDKEDKTTDPKKTEVKKSESEVESIEDQVNKTLKELIKGYTGTKLDNRKQYLMSIVGVANKDELLKIINEQSTLDKLSEELLKEQI